MKHIAKKILEYLIFFKMKKKVTLRGHNILFSRKSHINLLQGASKHNIVLHSHVKIHGTLSSCRLGKIEIGKFSQIGPGSVIQAVNSVVVGAYTAIASNVTISDNNSHPINPKDRKLMQMTKSGSIERSWIVSENAPIVIGSCCWIGENSRICKGVTIGNGSIVAASAVVTKDAPPNSIVAGNPAKVVKTNIDKTPRRLPIDSKCCSFEDVSMEEQSQASY